MSKAKITPLGDRVLVRHVDDDEQVKGGIIIPDSAKEKPQEAEVVALGTGKKDDDGNAIGFQVKKEQVVSAIAHVLAIFLYKLLAKCSICLLHSG